VTAASPVGVPPTNPWLLDARPVDLARRVRPGALLEHLGGRRVLISRDWSGKTLADHKADARDWVRALLGVTVDLEGEGNPEAATKEQSRYAWELARPDDPDVPPLAHRLLRTISERARWRAELDAAQDRARHGPPADISATEQAREGSR
jgi:hypothetical protein